MLSPSVKEKLGAGSFDGSAGSEVIVGAGGGVPSTLTVGCDPCSPNAAESWKSVVVQVYVASAEGALAAKAIVSVPPGQSSLPGSDAAASIVDTLRATVQVAAGHGSDAVVVAASEVGSTTNPSGTTTCALFAVTSDVRRLAI